MTVNNIVYNAQLHAQKEHLLSKLTSQQRQSFDDKASPIEEETKAVAKVTTIIIFLVAISLGVVITLLTKELDITNVILAFILIGLITPVNYYLSTYPKTKLEIEDTTDIEI